VRDARIPAVKLAAPAFEWALICDLIPVETTSVTVRRDAARAVGGFCPRLRMAEDREFLIRVRNMSYRQDQATTHGFRSTASTILNERGFRGEIIEAALAHQDEDEIRRAYNRALYLPQRKNLMQD
jgi:integrase